MVHLSLSNQRAYRFSSQSARKIARNQAVDDTNAASKPGSGEEIKNCGFDGKGGQLVTQQLSCADFRDEPGSRVDLGIGGIESVYIFEKNDAPGAEDLPHQVGTGVAAVGGRCSDVGFNT